MKFEKVHGVKTCMTFELLLSLSRYILARTRKFIQPFHSKLKLTLPNRIGFSKSCLKPLKFQTNQTSNAYVYHKGNLPNTSLTNPKPNHIQPDKNLPAVTKTYKLDLPLERFQIFRPLPIYIQNPTSHSYICTQTSIKV